MVFEFVFSEVNENFRKYIFENHSKLAFENIFFENSNSFLEIQI